MHSSLFFHRLVVVNNAIILLKYFHPEQYYNSTKSVVPLSDIHADTAFCPLQNAKAPFLTHCKLQQSHTPPVFHQRASINFFPVFSLFAIFILDILISISAALLSFHLGPRVSPRGWSMLGCLYPAITAVQSGYIPCRLSNK